MLLDLLLMLLFVLCLLCVRACVYLYVRVCQQEVDHRLCERDMNKDIDMVNMLGKSCKIHITHVHMTCNISRDKLKPLHVIWSTKLPRATT
jgi:hypothetical protein